MINVDLSRLNQLEQQIHEKLSLEAGVTGEIRIGQAAEICGCSSSKISKFVKKLGFANYKQYADFLYGKEPVKKKASPELLRIKEFIERFNYDLVDKFITLLNKHEKIILFGYGPSYLCTQYFEYKLRTSTNKYIMASQDEISVERALDKNSLLVIFTTTGSFRSFEHILSIAKEKKCEVLIVLEEYNASLFTTEAQVFWLCESPQAADLKPHEKSRTVFFIFIEEICQRLLSMNPS